MTLTNEQIECFLNDSENEIKKLDAIYENCKQILKAQNVSLQDVENLHQLDELKAKATLEAADEGRRRVMDLESHLGFTAKPATSLRRRGLRVW